MGREVYFKVLCSDTRFGWHLRVVGNCEALGRWDPAGGLVLSTHAAEFPVWRSANPVRLEQDVPVEYKYIICRDGGQVIRWEGATNRYLNLSLAVSRGLCPSEGPVTITEGFNMRLLQEQARFGGGVLRAASGLGMRLLAGSGSRFPASKQEHFAEADHFEPTMRERCASGTFLPSPRRSMSPSGAVPPEVTTADAPDAASEDAKSLKDCVDLGGLVREESISHLFYDGTPAQGTDELEVSQAFDDKYTLVGDKPLGEGTFGLLWRCQRKSGGAERAAKIVRKCRLDESEREFLLGVDGEISTHLNLKHPHIVELFEFFENSQTVSLVLEFCHGGDLFDAIVQRWEAKKKGLPEYQAVVAAKHVLLALEYLHDVHWVVHRDIKCENILISRAGVPLERNTFKLCDFGFATHDRGHGLHDRLGSPDTVAPEVVRGLTYSFPADMWSFGTVVYMMLAATSPFKAATDSDVLRRVAKGMYSFGAPIWDSISAPAKHLITSLMVVDARLRPTAQEALQKAWFTECPEVTDKH